MSGRTGARALSPAPVDSTPVDPAPVDPTPADSAPRVAPPGRTRITGKALTQLTAAIAATVLEVPVRQVRASVSDASGELGIRVQSPVVVGPLGRAAASRSPVPEAVPVTVRAERARARIADQVTALSGRRVGAITLEATGALIRERGRVS